MITVSNTTEQTLAPGQSITFDLVTFRSGCGAEYHRSGSGSIVLKCLGGTYNIDFSTNVGATAQGVAQLSVMLDGEALIGGTMISTTAAAGDLNNVAKPGLKVRNSGGNRVSITNTGTTTVTIPAKSALLSVKREG